MEKSMSLWKVSMVMMVRCQFRAQSNTSSLIVITCSIVVDRATLCGEVFLKHLFSNRER